MKQWQIWIDRGGTLTDIVARKPDGSLVTPLDEEADARVLPLPTVKASGRWR